MKQKICIVGDGLTGLTTAFILSRLNLKIDLVAPNFEKNPKDKRTTALSRSNYDFLLKFLGDKNAKLFWPSNKINLYHEISGVSKNFMSFEDEGKNLMYVIDNNKLKFLLKKKIKKSKNITILKKKTKKIDLNSSGILFGKNKIIYDSIFLCTGKGSNMVNDLIGKRYVQNDTRQIALTTVVKHNLKNLNPSQYFFKEGPLAVLPVSKNSFSLVWSLNRKFNLKNINNLVRQKLKIILGVEKIFNFSRIDFFPISLKLSVSYTKKNILILGEGSYSVHPIAGQGYNLILRDIKTLNKEIKNLLSIGMQLKDSQIFNNFVSLRKPENFLFGIGIDFINKFFSDNKIAAPVKSLILRDINKFKFLKDLSLNLSNKGIFY